MVTTDEDEDVAMTPLVRRWFELVREAYEAAARPACGREQDRIKAEMDEEDRSSLAPWCATLRRLTAAPETPERQRVVVAWLNGILGPLH
jgi:hypothetical protein